MSNFFIKLRHLTWRRVINKLIQMTRNFAVSFTLKKKPQRNMELFNRFNELTEDIADSNGSTYYRKAEIKIGIITDEFMYNYYKDAARFISIGHDSYKEIIDNADIDVMMYVSCWRGMNNNDWRGSERHGDVPKAIRYANERNITTVFQSIEDPTNYDRYLPIAKECDYIFTTDADCLPRYREDTGNQNVFLLEYGVNPMFHNPIGINRKYTLENVCDYTSVFFAGSWMDRYKQRCRDIRLLFDGIMCSGSNLVVADRNVNVKLPGYRFPNKYQPFVVPAIGHELLQKVHKLFEFNININTVQDSPTMCAMRIYELQALGCLMLSNYSLSVSERFPGIFMVNNYEEAKEILHGYSREEIYRMQVENLRNVMTDKTVFDRLNYMFEKCGIDYRFQDREVVVLCSEKSDKIVSMFGRQNYKNKRLMTESHYIFDENRECFIAWFDENHDYGADYLTDMMNSFKYCNAEFVTKSANDAEEYAFTDRAEDFGATVFTADKYEEVRWDGKKSAVGLGFKLDPFELNEGARKTVKEKEIAVIVPVYNNGRYLHGRCFRSLMRSSVFDRMQVYLIDDGSNDEETIKIIERLEERYDNVTAYFFEKGGSGSAARPRNKGIEISKEPYITFLDPDNEAISDGYSKLYEVMKQKQVNMAFGAIFSRINSEKLKRMGYLFKDQMIEDPKGLLLSENFRSQSIQACLIRRQLIVENRLTSPEGSIGQDTFFFHELMINAEQVYYINRPIHIYYAQRADSATNTISPEFFKKSFILEQYQAERLKAYGLLEEYITRKLDYFIVNWYIDKLSRTSETERTECIGIIGDIAALYGKSMSDYKTYLEEM